MTLPNKNRSILQIQSIAKLPEAIEITDPDILEKLKPEEGKPLSSKILFQLRANINYPRTFLPYLQSINEEIITQITYNRFIIFQMQETKHNMNDN